jgi:hypothetical protein
MFLPQYSLEITPNPQCIYSIKILLSMNIKIKCIVAALFLANTINNLGLAQSVIGKFHPIPWPTNSKVLRQKPLPDSGKNYLILTPDLANASLDHERVTIPFTVTNNSDKVIDVMFFADSGDNTGLAAMDDDGKKRYIDQLGGGGYLRPLGGGRLILKPGETSSRGSSKYPMYTLGAVTGRKIFGVIDGYFVGTTKSFTSYSAPFLVPPALTTLPYNDLGAQNYLSVTPDLTKVGFTGGDFKVTSLELQRADPHYADSIKNGWAQVVWIPITVANTSSQDLIAANDEIRFYIAGDENGKNTWLRDERWEYLKTSTPILKHGESCGSTGRDYITIQFLEDDGYKPGDKLIAMVGGRIPGTNNIFECYSAPFELPPLPKGEPPTAADNVNGTSTIPSADKTNGNKENSTASAQSQSSTTPAAQSAKQPAPQAPTEPEATPQRANRIWYIAGAALLALLAIFFIKRSRKK